MNRDPFTMGLDFPDELIIDNFAGGGGTSTGLEAAFGRPVDIAINHDPQALAMHAANHPHTRHLCESVWDVDPIEVTGNQPVALVWLSPDCKHFSKAKGGTPVKKHIRGLAWVGLRWIALTKPRVLMLENVEEFKTWGPLLIDAEGKAKPDPAKKGKTFESFVRQLRAHGYTVDWRELRACDYGAPTIRKRLFLIARRDGLPITWPTPTHGKPDSVAVQAGLQAPWRTAAECIDWSLPCPSIFGRSKELADATKRRIAKGIMRYVADAANPFIVPLTHQGSDRVERLDEPFRTITGANRGERALASATLVEIGYGERPGQAPRAPGIDRPLGTVVSGGIKHALVSAALTGVGGRAGQSRPRGADEPMATLTAKADTALVSAVLVDAAHGEVSPTGVKRWGQGCKDVQAPLGTVVASGGNQAIAAAFLAKHYTGVVGSDLEHPIGTVTSTDHHSLITAHIQRDMGKSVGHPANDPLGTITAGGGGKAAVVTSHIVKLRGTSTDGQPIGDPLHTVSAGGTHHGLVTSHLMTNTTGHPGASMDSPLPTITSAGNQAEVRAFLLAYYGTDQAPELGNPLPTATTKDRFGLVTIQGQDYQIVDIGLRMLSPRELYQAQGFPADYVIDHVPDWDALFAGGEQVTTDPAALSQRALTKSAQVRMCGNSVSPPMSEALVRANFAHESLIHGRAAA